MASTNFLSLSGKKINPSALLNMRPTVVGGAALHNNYLI